MPSRRRLRGIAALSAATLATAGLAGSTGAADECADASCGDEQVGLADLIEALGGEAVPGDALAKIELFSELLADEGGLLWKLEEGEAIPVEALATLSGLYEQLGLEIPAEAFLKLGDEGALLWKLEDGELSPELAFPKVESGEPDSELAFPKLEDPLAGMEGMEGVEALFSEQLMTEMGAGLPMLEEALLKLEDSGEFDPDLLKAFLEMVPDDE